MSNMVKIHRQPRSKGVVSWAADLSSWDDKVEFYNRGLGGVICYGTGTSMQLMRYSTTRRQAHKGVWNNRSNPMIHAPFFAHPSALLSFLGCVALTLGLAPAEGSSSATAPLSNQSPKSGTAEESSSPRASLRRPPFCKPGQLGRGSQGPTVSQVSVRLPSLGKKPDEELSFLCSKSRLLRRERCRRHELTRPMLDGANAAGER